MSIFCPYWQCEFRTLVIPKVFKERIKGEYTPSNLLKFLWTDSEAGGFARRHQRFSNGVGQWLFQLFSCSDLTRHIVVAAFWKLSQYLCGQPIPKSMLEGDDDNSFLYEIITRGCTNGIKMSSWLEWKPSLNDVANTLRQFGCNMPAIDGNGLPVNGRTESFSISPLDCMRLDYIIKFIVLCVWRGHHQFSSQEDIHRMILLCCSLSVDPQMQKHGFRAQTVRIYSGRDVHSEGS